MNFYFQLTATLEVDTVDTAVTAVDTAATDTVDSAASAMLMPNPKLGTVTPNVADAVKAAKAKVTILGSGGAAFASDGDVDATIMGSGSVTVKGRARCKVHGATYPRCFC